MAENACPVHKDADTCAFFYCPNQSVPPLADGRRNRPVSEGEE